MSAPPEGAIQSTLKSRHGPLLTTYRWLPQGSSKAAAQPLRGIAIYAHGWGSHACYDLLTTSSMDDSAYGGAHTCYRGSFVEHLNKRLGLAVLAFDCQSMGRSEGQKGLRAYFYSLEHLVDDALDVLIKGCADIRDDDLANGSRKSFEKPERVPVFLIGLSLGGGVMVRLAARLCSMKNDYIVRDVGQGRDPVRLSVFHAAHPDKNEEQHNAEKSRAETNAAPQPNGDGSSQVFEVRGLVTVSAAVTLERLKSHGINKYLSCIAPYARLCLPSWLELTQLPPNPKYAHKHREHLEDSLTFKGPQRLNTVIEILRHSQLLADDPQKVELRKITLPFLGFHAPSDRITDPKSLEVLRDGVGTRDVTVVWHCDGYHHLIQEPNNHMVRTRMKVWMKERLDDVEGMTSIQRERTERLQ